MAPASTAGFPSRAHRDALGQRVKDGGWLTLTNREQWQWHAYNYAWRCVRLNEHGRSYAADPDGRWFDPGAVKQAERFLAAEQRAAKPAVQSRRDRVAAAYRWTHALGQTMPGGIPENDPRVAELVRRFEAAQASRAYAQERELASLRAKIAGDGKRPDGSWSPEAIAHMEHALRLMRSNLGLPAQPADGDPIGALQRALGISATAAADDG